MNKYFFAKYYLKALLACAVLVLVYGILVSSVKIVGSANYVKEIRALRAKKSIIDTYSVGHEYDVTIKLLNKYSKPGIALQPLATNSCDISAYASLDYQQHMMFSIYVDSITRNTDIMKESIVSNFNERIDAIIFGAQKALPKEQTSRPPALVAAASQPSSSRSIFIKGGISEQDVEYLKSSSQFLNFKINSYSPDPKVKELALGVDVKLQDIIRMLNNELEILNKPREYAYQQSDNNAQVNTQSRDKNAIITELIENLQLIKGLVNNTSISKWNIDSEIEKARVSIKSYVEQIQEKETVLKSSAIASLISGGAYLLGAIISAIILLVIRDFMSAIIDTATNTGGMFKKLSGMNVEVE